MAVQVEPILAFPGPTDRVYIRGLVSGWPTETSVSMVDWAAASSDVQKRQLAAQALYDTFVRSLGATPNTFRGLVSFPDPPPRAQAPKS